MKQYLPLLLLFCIVAACRLDMPAQAIPKNANERLVLDFYNLAFNAHKPAENAQRYIGARYIQHNPLVPN